MTTAKEIIKLAPTIQSMALLGENMKFMKKKKKNAGDFIGMGMTNIVGVEMIKAQSDIIEGMD